MSSLEYILLYKPFQVLSQFSPEGDKKTLAHVLPNISKDIYPVGRLDYDSEGLLLLTNDTRLNKKLLHPESGYQKEYWVQVEGQVSDSDLEALRTGVEISVNGKMHFTSPAICSILHNDVPVAERNPPIRFRKNIPTTWISITIKEGKNRQVRKMTASIGFPTLRLVRTAIGTLKMGSLKPGDHLRLSPVDLNALLSR